MRNFEMVITALEEGINGFLLFSATIILFINVVLRYIFSNSIPWAEEIIRYAIVWVTFLGGSLCVKNRLHVGIDILVVIVPPFVKRILMLIAQLSSAVFTGFITIYGLQNTMLVVETAQKSPAMMMPMWILYMSLPLGSALMTIRFLIVAWNLVKDKEYGVQDEKAYVDIDNL
ncbi:MAG: TRAP transporter small permease [Bacillota bacterium]